MSWQFWKKRKKRTNAGGIEVNLRAEGVKEHDAAIDDAKARTLELARPEREVIHHVAYLAPGQGGSFELALPKPQPMIHQITAPIVWRDDPVGTRYGPGRCSPECTEVHAYAEKVSPTTVAFMRPCCPEDMGAAEWRARQKR